MCRVGCTDVGVATACLASQLNTPQALFVSPCTRNHPHYERACTMSVRKYCRSLAWHDDETTPMSTTASTPVPRRV